MRTIRGKVLVICLLFFSIKVLSFGDGLEAPAETRSVLLCIGAGLSLPSYGPDLDSALQLAAAGNTRVDVFVDLGIGLAVSDKVFILLKGNGFGTRIEDDQGDWVQLNYVITGGAVRYYPNSTGIFLEGGVGISQILFEGSGTVPVESTKGIGVVGTLGYDFGGFKGLSLSVAASAAYAKIETDTLAGIGIFVSLNWKI
jgi:hypothetical protein